jgi:hypothetical protein
MFPRSKEKGATPGLSQPSVPSRNNPTELIPEPNQDAVEPLELPVVRASTQNVKKMSFSVANCCGLGLVTFPFRRRQQHKKPAELGGLQDLDEKTLELVHPQAIELTGIVRHLEPPDQRWGSDLGVPSLQHITSSSYNHEGYQETYGGPSSYSQESYSFAGGDSGLGSSSGGASFYTAHSSGEPSSYSQGSYSFAGGDSGHRSSSGGVISSGYHSGPSGDSGGSGGPGLYTIHEMP